MGRPLGARGLGLRPRLEHDLLPARPWQPRRRRRRFCEAAAVGAAAATAAAAAAADAGCDPAHARGSIMTPRCLLGPNCGVSSADCRDGVDRHPGPLLLLFLSTFLLWIWNCNVLKKLEIPGEVIRGWCVAESPWGRMHVCSGEHGRVTGGAVDAQPVCSGGGRADGQRAAGAGARRAGRGAARARMAGGAQASILRSPLIFTKVKFHPA